MNIDAEEKPKTGTVSYIIEAAPVSDKKSSEESKTGPQVPKDISVVFCVDISGSMSGSRIHAVKETILM